VKLLTDLPVLFSDDAVVVVDKPAGVLSHPNRSGGQRCAFRGDYDPETRRFRIGEENLWLLHRLDKETSGALLAARSESAAANLREQFEAQSIGKRYAALVDGRPGRPSAGRPSAGKASGGRPSAGKSSAGRSSGGRPSGTWRDHIAKRSREGGRQVRSTVVRQKPANAELRYELAESFRRFGLSLLTIRLVTGRTHQIRVQAAERRHPVAGDRIYGNFRRNRELRDALGLRRMFLHAAGLEFLHPGSGEALRVDSPLPPELESVLERTRARE